MAALDDPLAGLRYIFFRNLSSKTRLLSFGIRFAGYDTDKFFLNRGMRVYATTVANYWGERRGNDDIFWRPARHGEL